VLFRSHLHKRREERTVERTRTLVSKQLHHTFWTEEREHALREGIGAVMKLQSTPYDLSELLIKSFGQS
jgi:hypothetical protein